MEKMRLMRTDLTRKNESSKRYTYHHTESCIHIPYDAKKHVYIDVARNESSFLVICNQSVSTRLWFTGLETLARSRDSEHRADDGNDRAKQGNHCPHVFPPKPLNFDSKSQPTECEDDCEAFDNNERD